MILGGTDFLSSATLLFSIQDFSNLFELSIEVLENKRTCRSMAAGGAFELNYPWPLKEGDCGLLCCYDCGETFFV